MIGISIDFDFALYTYNIPMAKSVINIARDFDFLSNENHIISTSDQWYLIFIGLNYFGEISLRSTSVSADLRKHFRLKCDIVISSILQ